MAINAQRANAHKKYHTTSASGCAVWSVTAWRLSVGIVAGTRVVMTMTNFVKNKDLVPASKPT